MDLSIDFGTLNIIVTRSLSVIGKRSTDDNGNLMFRDITLGSREKGIIADFFYNAFVDICSELDKFVTAVIEDHSGLTTVIYTRWWTDQPASSFESQISASGEYLYNYSTDVLYMSSLSFPFSTVSPENDNLFVHGGTYYKWDSGLVQLTDEEVAELTEEEKTSATVLTYYDTDPATVSETSADVYLYYNGSVYKSERSATFSPETIPAGAGIADPAGRIYKRYSNVLVEIPSGMEDTVTLTVTMPDNWNPSLQKALQQAITGYCVAYALYSWFTITAPRISEKYQGDMQRNLSAIIRLAHEKMAPESAGVSPVSVSTSVS